MIKLLTLFSFVLVAFTANAQSCPDANHPHMIDLGLPSGTKWACCNVGANTPESYGGYYAWGEVEEKEVYNEVTYQYCSGEDADGDGRYEQNVQYQNLGSDIAGIQYDVAHVQWGGSWVIPSKSQIKELTENSTYIWTIINGINGQRFIGPNGNTIFLPAAGYRFNDELYHVGSTGHYWSSTQYPSSLNLAYGLDFYSGDAYWNYGSYNNNGHTVRPVIKVTTSINPPESSSETSSQAIYNLYGIKVADNAADMNALPPGIYIANGKKMVIK